MAKQSDVSLPAPIMPAMGTTTGTGRIIHYRPPVDGRDYVVRIMLFLSSYAILFGLTALRVSAPYLVHLFFLVLAIAGFAAFLWILRARSNNSHPHEAASVEDAGADVAGYVVGYLLPLLVAPNPSNVDVVTYIVFFIVIGLIYVHSDLVHIQPLLYLFGYRVFRVETIQGGHYFLVAKHEPPSGHSFLAAPAAGRLLVRQLDDDHSIEEA